MTLVISLLGQIELSRAEQSVSMRGAKPVALLAYLLVTGKAHPRQHLVDLLFDGPADPKGSLRWTLSELRQAIGAGYILAGRQEVAFNFDSDYWLDVAAFEAGQLELYRGDFLAELNVRNAPGFEQWVLLERERLKGVYQSRLVEQLEAAKSRDDDQAVIETVQPLLALDNLREGWHRALMRAYARQGQRDAALAQFELCRQVLAAELGVEPAAETAALAEAIRKGQIKVIRPPVALSTTGSKPIRIDYPSTPLHNLPPQPTPFIGREAELAALNILITNPAARLITVIGPGGIGKTRLALALAERQLETDRFPNGVYFVNLAPLNSAEHIITAVVEALGFPLDTGEQQTRTAKQQILDYLHRKQMLLVLDNFEHLLSPPSTAPKESTADSSIGGAEELVIDILQTAAKVRILATSRERLHLHQEQLFPLRGLTFPEVEAAKVAAEYDAVRLFVQSARRIRPDFELRPNDLSDVTRICRLLEGLPLGIELAAAWVDVLSLAGIAAEIQQSLDFLEVEVRNVPERQRSIRAVFDTSWQRMTAAEQKIFPQLAVFRGGFTRRAAQEVTGASLRLVGTLSSKSLLQYDQGRDRYQIHELLRQYGAEKLSAESPGETAVRDRHSVYYCAALRQREDDLKGARQQAALDEIEADSENVRAAWHWAIQHEDTAQLALAMNALGMFYEWQGRFQDGSATFGALLASPLSVSAHQEPLFWARAMAWASVFQRLVETTEVAHKTLAQALKLLEGLESSVDGHTEQAFLYYQQGNLALSQNNAAAQTAFLTSLGFYRQVKDQWGMARALHGLGEAHFWLGDFAAAGTHLAESLAIYRALGDWRGMAAVTLTASITARYQGRLEDSLRLGEECLEISRQISNRSLVAEALGDLSMSHGRVFGRYAQAYDLQSQGLAIAADLGNPWQLSNAYYRRGELAAHLGNFKAAEDDLRQAVVVDRESGYRINMAYALITLGQLLMAGGERAEARRVLEQALSICRELDHLDGTLSCIIFLTLLETNSTRWEAEQKLFEILKGSYERRAWIPFELVLPAIAALLLETPEITTSEIRSSRFLLAIEITGLVDRGSRLRQRLVFDRLNELATSLPPDVVAAAKERGRQLDWWPMAAYLLEALPRLGWGQSYVEEPGTGRKVPPHNLPPQPTPFIGREEELTEIMQRLTDRDCRLLTIVGPGGIGKTRLSLATAERQLAGSSFPDGVYFVSLAELGSADFLVSTIAESLNVAFYGDEEPQEHLLTYLGAVKQPMLLVLDNFEHLLIAQGAEQQNGTTFLLNILQRAPAVKLLVTSRERLNLRGEWLLDIRGLPFPKTNQDQTSKVLETSFEVSKTRYGAVQLFEQRAQQVQANFDLTAEYRAVIRICQLVEGMPLGLELAAAWARLLSCQEIAQEIERNLEFLTSPLRDVPARHRSLAAVFDHSWHHLSPEEQRVFRSLAVFRGGFSREAAEQVAAASLPLLAALVDKSLLRRNDLGRYELHELLGQYAAEKLDESGETDQVRSRHLAFFLELAEEAEPKLHGAEQATWLKKLNIENGNLRAALAWSLEGGNAQTGLRLAATLGQFWFMRSQGYDEGIRWLERVLAETDPSEQTEERAQAFHWLGQFALYRSDDATASKAFQQSLALYRALGDKTGIADSLLFLGDIASFQGDDIAARSLYAEARSAYEESLVILRERGDAWTMARSLNYLGEIARFEEDYAAARSFYKESLALRRKLGDTRGIAVSLYNLGHVVHYQGDVRQAATYFEESLTLSQELRDKRGVADGLVGLAGVAGNTGQLERAARLFGAAETLYEDSVVRLEYSDQVEYDRNVAIVRAQLDEATFAAAWAAGRAMTLEQAVDYALAL